MIIEIYYKNYCFFQHIFGGMFIFLCEMTFALLNQLEKNLTHNQTKILLNTNNDLQKKICCMLFINFIFLTKHIFLVYLLYK